MNPVLIEYAAAAKRQMIRARAGAEAEQIELARADDNAFCEYAFINDQTGQPLVQAWHHREWQRLTCEHDRLVMWYPIEHGKTTQAKMKLCRLLGQHPDRQYAYISSKQLQARKLLGAVKREIEGNERLRAVYPELEPQRQQLSKALEEWGTTRIRVNGCPRGSKDASLQAFGLDGQILGSRFHGVILDNILDKANTRTSDQRKWVVEILEDEILGRVMDGGFVWILDTAWYEDDALHVLAERDGWQSAKFSAEDGRGDDETLWPAQWPAARLAAKKAEIGTTAYDRQFRNAALGESTQYFKLESWEASYGRCSWMTSWPEWEDGDVYMVTGVDLATRAKETADLTAFTTVVARGARRRLVNLESDRITGPDILRAIVDLYQRFHAPVIAAGGYAAFIVEDNAAQAYIVQLLQDVTLARAWGLTEAEIADIRVIGRTTTAKKRDEELGIPSLAAAIEMGRWDIAAGAETRALREEMRCWSPDAGHYGDRLMSMWIADMGLREAGAFEPMLI